jgi:hypothetical protein
VLLEKVRVLNWCIMVVNLQMEIEVASAMPMAVPPVDWKSRPLRSRRARSVMFKGWVNKRRAARGEPLLPYMTQLGE